MNINRTKRMVFKEFASNTIILYDYNCTFIFDTLFPLTIAWLY